MEQGQLFGGPGNQIGEIETWARRQGYRWIVGVDEAGRGPLAGPVYAAAVMLDLDDLDQAWIGSLDDSKKLTEAQRERGFDAIHDGAVHWAIASRDSQVVDEVNILRATQQAMVEAIEEVCQAFGGTPDCVFIDGNVPVDIDMHQRTVVRGDGRSYHIAAASILAKVARDREMVEHDRRWPQYGFAHNKGYGTAEHRAAIQTHGPCSIHRLTFSGVREHAYRLK